MAVQYVQNLLTTYLTPLTVPYQRTVLQFNVLSVPYLRSKCTVPSIFGTDCTAVLFNLMKNSEALFKTVKFLNVSDLALSIISKK